MDPEPFLKIADESHAARWRRYDEAGARAAKATPKDPEAARSAAVRRMIVRDAIADGWTASRRPTEAERVELEQDAIFHRRRLAEGYRLASVLAPAYLVAIAPQIAALVRVARLEGERADENAPLVLRPILSRSGAEYLPDDVTPQEPETRNARRAVELLLDEVRRDIAPPPDRTRIPWAEILPLLPVYDALPRDGKADFQKREARRLGLSRKTLSRALERGRAERSKGESLIR